MKSNIALIGFMGCGKTTVAKGFATQFQFSFLDTDDWIVNKTGSSIPHIFEKYGEYYFRDLETEAAAEAARQNQTIVATGGGIVLRETNISILKETCILVYLQADAHTIWDRMKHDTDRPLLHTENRLQTICEMLEKRAPLYEQYADITVAVDGKTVAACVNELGRRWKDCK